MSYVLTGTADELKSSRALKVIATAMATPFALTRTVVSSPEQVAARTTPLAKSMALSIHVNHAQTRHYGGTSHLMMRILATTSGGNLNGDTHVDKANVDAWIDFIWSAIDIPVALLLGSNDSTIQKELNAALAIVERHLRHRTFLVGSSGPTICNIALTAALHQAGDFWKSSNNTNLSRFYNTMIHQDFWIQALEIHASDPELTV